MKSYISIILFFNFFILIPTTKGSTRDTLVVNVKDFGAKGDGKSDDTQAIQKALNYKSSKVLKVVFPSGVFRINKAIRTSKDHTQIFFKNGSKLLLANNIEGGINILNDYCSVVNGTIVGNSKPSSSIYTGYGILLSGTKNSRVQNCTLEHISGISIFLNRRGSEGCQNSEISGNKILNPAVSSIIGTDGSGILIGYSGKGYSHVNNKIVRNFIEGGKGLNHGIALIGRGSNNIIAENIVQNCLRYGIVLYESDYEHHVLYNNKVLGNKVSRIGAKEGSINNMGMGIYLMKSHNSIVKDNDISDVLQNSDDSETLARGAIAISGSVACEVTDNFIKNSGRYGIVGAYCFDSQIRANTIENIRESGIYLINSNNVTIKDNVLTNIAKLMIRGFFGNTSNEKYKNNSLLPRFNNIPTGQRILISNNLFNSGKEQIIVLVGEDKFDNTLENYLENVTISSNTQIGSRGSGTVNSIVVRNGKKNIKIANNNFFFKNKNINHEN